MMEIMKLLRTSVLPVIFLGILLVGLPVKAEITDLDLFEPYWSFDVGSFPHAVAVGDVNNDGRNDVVLTTSFDYDEENDFRVFVFFQDTEGNLMDPVSYLSQGIPISSVGIADVTGDGLADVVVGLARNGIEVFPQESNGTLGSSIFYPTIDSEYIRLGDLNNDSWIDVVGVGLDTDTATIMIQNEFGFFDEPVSYSITHRGGEDLEVGDVNGDGLTDIVVMQGQGGTPNLGVLVQKPSGLFASPVYYSLDEDINTHGVGVGDVTGDGLNDIVVSYGGNKPASHVGVFAQNESGKLDPVVSYPAYDIPGPVDVADLDLDGLADVATAHEGWGELGVFRQTTTGTLAPEELYHIPYGYHSSHGLAIGDVNGDGAPDVILADHSYGLIVLYNTTEVPWEPGVADVGVDIDGFPRAVKQGKPYSFTASVTNQGPDSATGIELIVKFDGPYGTLFVSDPDCSVSFADVSCNFDSLSVDTVRDVVINGIGTEKGWIEAAAFVSSIDVDNFTDNNSDTAKIRIRR